MALSSKQVAELRRDLNPDHVRSRDVQGRSLSYIEGWHAISEANRIFGFDGWDRETVETKCVIGRENRGSYHAVYLAKVRITVRAEDCTVFRDGYGSGEAQGGSAGETHERAVKTAETDATKRALATFGKPFGLSLYLSSRNRDIQNPLAGSPPIADHLRRRTFQQPGLNGRYYAPRVPRTVIEQALASRPTRTSAGQNAGQAPTRMAQPQSDTAETTPQPEAPHSRSQPPSLEPRDSKSPPMHGDDPASTGAPPLQPVADGASAGPQLLIDWPKRRREPEHLKFVRSQPCLLCGRTPSDAHHLRFAQARAMSRKVSDEYTVPLCRTHHRQLHRSGNELAWWEAADADVDPIEVAKGLWEESRQKLGNGALLIGATPAASGPLARKGDS